MSMTSYTEYNGVTHYTVRDIFDADCYFFCEFKNPLDHSDGFSYEHRNTLPLVYSSYPTCVGCLQAMIGELQNQLDEYISALNFNTPL